MKDLNKQIVHQEPLQGFDEDRIFEHEILHAKVMYSEEEVKKICESAYKFGFNGGEAEYTCTSPSRLHNCKTFDVWFNQRKKK